MVVKISVTIAIIACLILVILTYYTLPSYPMRSAISTHYGSWTYSMMGERLIPIAYHNTLKLATAVFVMCGACEVFAQCFKKPRLDEIRDNDFHAGPMLDSVKW